jgi:HPt (histidine-containing phosphotransfer) domain-containing protein
MSEPLFDENRFLQSLAGDVELARELLAAFMEDSPERAASLGKALDAADADQASKMAHSLKGMCGVVRSSELVALALHMEETAKEGDLAETRTHFEEFSGQLREALDRMRRFLNEH